MDWFNASDVIALQSVSEGLLKDTASLLRVIGAVAAISERDPGQDYEPGDILTLTPISGIVATVEVIDIDIDGGIVAVDLVTRGEGFAAGAYVASGGSGTGATFNVDAVNQPAYANITDLKCRVFPPGVMKSSYRSLVPSHLRGVPIGEIEVRLDDGNAHAIAAKDRLAIGSRVFEVVAPLTGRTIEIRRKLIVREIQQPERELWLALKPDGYDGGSVSEALPELIRVLPAPYISDKQVETVAESEGRGAEIARLKQLEVYEVALPYFSEANRSRLLYSLIVNSGTVPTPEQARDKAFPRYLFNGSPSLENDQWSMSFPWCVALVEER
jgi:hypothetical protein